MWPKEAATLTASILSKYTFWLVLSTTPLLAGFLEKFHGIHISLSTTLKRRLRDYGLKRRNSADLK